MASALPSDLKSLTSLRFFAAFWVFLFHLRSREDFEPSWFVDFVTNGARGVDFFFILSGFVILHVYDGEFSRKDFLVKRFARIYPLHALMTVVFIAVAFISSNPVEGVFQSIFLLHAFSTTNGLVLNGPSWTLSAEMFAYACFALIPVKRTWVIALAFAITFILAHFVSLNLGKSAFLHMTWDYGALRIIPLFLLGMFLRRLSPRVSTKSAFIMGIIGTILFFGLGTIELIGYAILIPFAMLIVAGACLSNRSIPTNNKILVYLGEISYSIYMVHVILIAVFYDYFPKIGFETPGWLLISLAVIGASSASYHLIEVPARKWINARLL